MSLFRKLKKEFKEPFFWVYFIVFLFFTLVWLCSEVVIVRLISIVLVVGVHSMKMILFPKARNTLNWIYLVVFISFLFFYFAAVIFEKFELALGLALIIVGVPCLVAIYYSFRTTFLNILNSLNVKEKFELPSIIIAYVGFFLTTTLISSVFFLLTGITDSEGVPVDNMWSVLYFSALTFYSMSFGELQPTNLSKLFVVVELVISSIVHIIIIAWVFKEADRKRSKK